MDDLFYSCVFEAIEIVQRLSFKIEVIPSREGSLCYKNLSYKSNFFEGQRYLRISWLASKPEPVHNANSVIKYIAEDLYLYLKRGS